MQATSGVEIKPGDPVRYVGLGFDGTVMHLEPSLSTRYYGVEFDRLGYVARVPESKITKLT